MNNRDRDYQEIVDANGGTVISSSDAEDYKSWFEGDVDGLIEWVNTHPN